MKCLKEEVQANVLVAGEYQVSLTPAVKTEYIVRDSKGDILSKKEDIPHDKMLKFSFVTETYDTFEICFIAHGIQPSFSGNVKQIKQEVHLIVKRGIEAKNYDGVSLRALSMNTFHHRCPSICLIDEISRNWQSLSFKMLVLRGLPMPFPEISSQRFICLFFLLYVACMGTQLVM